jgi:hypothetical protein
MCHGHEFYWCKCGPNKFGNLSYGEPTSSLQTKPVDALSDARAKVRSHGLCLGNIPRNLNDPIWSELRLDPISLSLPQLIALRSYIMYPNKTDFASGTEPFSKSGVSELQNCLDSVADVSVKEALITAERAFIKAPANTTANAADVMEAMIDNHRQQICPLVTSLGISEEHCLAVRLYTLKKTNEDPIAIYEPINRELNNSSRSRELLSYYYLYMRILIKGLRSMQKAGHYRVEDMAYRGLKIQGNRVLQSKYDHYQSCFTEGSLLTMAGFTSVSLNIDIAENEVFCDKLIYELLDVTGVDLSMVSRYQERELLLIPPCVFRIEGTRMDNEKLVVTMRHIRQTGANYLSGTDTDEDYHSDSNIGQNNGEGGNGDAGVRSCSNWRDRANNSDAQGRNDHVSDTNLGSSGGCSSYRQASRNMRYTEGEIVSHNVIDDFPASVLHDVSCCRNV